MTPEARLVRYERFVRVTFGVQVSDENKKRYMCELLPFESSFADSQDSIGEVYRYPFKIEVDDHTPFRHKAIHYPPCAREWLQKQCDILVRRGIIERVEPGEEEPLFVSNVVLVPEG